MPHLRSGFLTTEGKPMSCSIRERTPIHFLVALTFLFLLVIPLRAQSCAGNNFDEVRIAKLLQTAYGRCPTLPSEGLVYKIAAVAGQAAVPALREFVNHPTDCPYFNDQVETALAKLGDAAALQYLANRMDLYHLGIVGDDRAISVMMTYFEQHRADKAMTNQGDYMGGSPLTSIAVIIGSPNYAPPSIGQRRLIPGISTLPLEPGGNPVEIVEGKEFKEAWINWWEMHKDEPLTVAPYKSEKDPYLRCLARQVDWSFPNALLEIADHGGPEALALLKKFPPPPGEPVVYHDPGPKDLFGTASGGGFGAVSTMSGDLVLALAKMGDPKEFAKVASTHSVEELEYIGGEKSVEILIGQLKTPAELSSEEVQTLSRCIQLDVGGGMDKGDAQRGCESEVGGGAYARCVFSRSKTERRACEERAVKLATSGDTSHEAPLLSALSHMVVNPPLPPDASPTNENIQKWRDWWAKNKDTAEYIQNPLNASDLRP